jgi:MoxR-like ATPase
MALDRSGQGLALGRGRIGLALAESQVAAIRLALMSKVLVMTSGPGVGKTTIVKAILRILAAKGTKLLLTRGKRLVVLVGQKKAVAIAVRNVSGRRRWSKLQKWLRPGPSLSRPIDTSTAPDIGQPLDRAARPAGKPAPLSE